MIVVSSNYLNAKEKTFIRKYASFVLNRMVRRGIQNKAKVLIKVMSPEEFDAEVDKNDLINYNAWCTYDGVENDLKRFTVVVNINSISKRAKQPLVKYRTVLVDLGHELTHVKQYLNNELFDYKSGDVRFKGLFFDASHYMDEEKYFDSPWEIEAYGRELGLYKIFCNKLKEERLSK